MKNNITKSWRTSALGTIVVASACISVFVVDSITWWPEGVAGIVAGAGLMFAPDKLLSVFGVYMKRKAK